jgi:leucyl aminopeptidase
LPVFRNDFDSGFETNFNNIVPIEFDGISIPSKIFYGKKDSVYLIEKETISVFIGLGKTIDYPSLKTIFRRIASKQRDFLTQAVAIVIPESFSESLVEATVSGLFTEPTT